MAASGSAEERINLATLQQTDPYIRSILANAKHITLYSFRSQANEWEKTDVEGTCFVYERSVPPHHGFMILNRLGRQNFIEPITEHLEFQVQDPFLLYRNSTAIYGIWFYEDWECKALNQLLNKLVQVAKMKLASPGSQGHGMTAAGESSGGAEGSVDILGMLTKAQSDFMGKQEPHVMTTHPSGHPVKPLPVKANIPTAGSKDKAQSISIEDLFKKADLDRQPAKPTNPAAPPAIQSQISLPADKVRTVSELEEQHHTPVQSPGLLPSNTNQLLTPGSITGQSPVRTPAKSLQAEVKTELMSPMAFSVDRRDSSSVPVAVNPPQHFEMSESMLSGFQRRDASLNSSSGAISSEPVSALTKDQLKQAMLHLLQNDDHFLDYIHNGYIQSLTSSLRR